jgi:hypothetical protein
MIETSLGFAVWPEEETMGTCILHLTSSIGVNKREVKAPETAPQSMRAEIERGSDWGRIVALSTS